MSEKDMAAARDRLCCVLDQAVESGMLTVQEVEAIGCAVAFLATNDLKSFDVDLKEATLLPPVFFEMMDRIKVYQETARALSPIKLTPE